LGGYFSAMAPYKSVYLQAGAARIELVAFAEERRPDEMAGRDDDVGFKHIGFAVDPQQPEFDPHAAREAWPDRRDGLRRERDGTGAGSTCPVPPWSRESVPLRRCQLR